MCCALFLPVRRNGLQVYDGRFQEAVSFVLETQEELYFRSQGGVDRAGVVEEGRPRGTRQAGSPGATVRRHSRAKAAKGCLCVAGWQGDSFVAVTSYQTTYFNLKATMPSWQGDFGRLPVQE